MAQRALIRNLPWIYILSALVIILGLLLFRGFASKETYPVRLTGNTRIYLGLSVVEQDFSTVLREISDNNKKSNDWLTSFLIQSPYPAALVYLDYIDIPENPSLPDNICFRSITFSRSQSVPIQIAPEIIPSGLKIMPEKYSYEFPSERCMPKGQKYIMPHIFLGALSVNSSANVLGLPVTGFRAVDYFPLDQQNISFDISVETDNFIFSPSIEAVVAQKGWQGSFNFDDAQKPVLHLARSPFYKWGLTIFFFIMALTIPSLAAAMRRRSDFFEIAFGLILGLWGMHEILIPNYIQTSIPIDVVIYILYVLLILAIWVILLQIRRNPSEPD